MKNNRFALLLADGFEEIEALLPLDILLRAGCEVTTVGINGKEIKGAHGVIVKADMASSEADLNLFDHLILPGGMPGAKNLDESAFVDKILDSVINKGGCISAICAAPFILGKRGLLQGKKAVCYPGFEKHLNGATVVENSSVVSDGNIVTAKGMGAALPFSYEIIRVALKKDEEFISPPSPHPSHPDFFINV